jgi:hypothetical protein
MAASDTLHRLSDRAKQAEQKATAASQQGKADLEKTVERSRASAQAEATKLRERAQASHGQISTWWDEQQQAWNAHRDKMRQSIEEKKVQHEAKEAEKRAEQAEADASFAIDYAAIGEAESAVVEAILARVNAHEAALVSPGSTR